MHQSIGEAHPRRCTEQLGVRQARGYVRFAKRVNFTDREFLFSEFFSGPRAPLTEAVKAAWASVVQELQPPTIGEASVVFLEGSPHTEETWRPTKQPNTLKPLSAYQRAELATGRQPRWNSNQQLIQDGIDDELAHLALARLLKHPGQLEGELPSDLRNSIDMVTSSPAEVIRHRLRAIEIIR